MAVAASAVGAAILGEAAIGTIGAGLLGGAVLGAGAGALYSAVTGDGNILNSALTGALIGGGVGAAGAAAGPALMGEAAGATAVTGAEAAASASPALQAAQGLTSSNIAGLNQAALSQGVFAEGSAALPGAGLAAAPETIAPALTPAVSSASVDPSTGLMAKTATDKLSNKEILGYGLAGTAALSLLGSRHPNTLSGTNTGTSGPAMIRPYTYSQTKNPNYGQPGEPYFIQTSTPGAPYKAATGGLMAIGGPVERMSQNMMGGQQNMYPQSQQEHTNFATPTQMPTSAEIIRSDFDTKTNPYTGDITMARGGIARYADGGFIPDELMAQVRAAANQPAPAQNAPMPAPVTPATLVAPTTAYTPAPQAPTQLQQQISDYNRNIAESANQEYNIAPPPLAGLPGGGQNASTSDLKRIINQYYLQNLGRQGDEAGLTDWASKVHDQGTSLSDIVKGIRGSTEGIVYQDYQNLLGRRPDETGSAYWQQQLTSGVSPEDIRKSIMGSQEYLKLHPEIVAAQKAQADYEAAPITAQTFDANAYLIANPDVARAGIDPWTHYTQYGQREGRPAPRIAYQAPVTTTPTANTGYTYNPITKTYTAPNLGTNTTASTATNAMYTAPDGSLWANKDAYDRAHPVGEAAGGLMKGYASGGLPGYNLGGYSDGGRLLKGPGDGMSDNIPASIADKQPARLADGEFVVPADVVSHLGNGSTDAGAKRLYSMMDNVRKARTGNKKQGKQIKADKFLPT